MKKIRNVFFMLVIIMSMMCTVAYAEPTAEPAAAPAAETQVQPTEKPKAEPTVAPELADNQINATSGAKAVVFTIHHKDTIEISIISPSEVVLTASSANVKTQSITGGTVVTISNPETGIWTMNASSTMGEAVKVESKCEYNFMVELQCEKDVIYNGVSSKFFAFVKTKDGTNIDPNVLRASTITLYIREADAEKAKAIDMTFKGAAFETSYTYNDVGKLVVWAEAVVNDVTIESKAINIISILEPNTGGGLPIWVILLIVVAVTGFGVYMYIHFADRLKNTKGTANMSGNITINIDVNGDAKLPISRNLAMMGTSVGMLTLIGDDEYYDVDGITLSGSNNGLKVVNKSRCEVLFSNVGADPNGVKLMDGQYFKIFMPDEKTVITVTYRSDDVFTSLINTAASEQQKQEEAAAVNNEEQTEPIAAPIENTESIENIESVENAENTAEQIAEEVKETIEEQSPVAENEDAAENTVENNAADSSNEETVQEVVPELADFSFGNLTEDEEKPNSADEKADEASEADVETATFTIDTSDAEEVQKNDEEEYSFDTAPALESFSFSGLLDNESDNGDTNEVSEDIAEEASEKEDADIIDFGDLASLAADVAAENASVSENSVEEISDEDTGINFSDLASLAADVADENEKKIENTDNVEEISDEDTGINFSDLASLAADVADEIE